MTRLHLLAAAVVLAAAPALAAPTRAFLNEAAKGDQSEATLGRYIAGHGGSAAVRQYGAMLSRDHGSHRVQVAQLARRMNVSLAGGMMPEAARELDKLHGMRGPTFDREVRRYMIEDHEKDIAKYQAQVRGGDRQTAALARQTLPVLRHHLQAARSL